MNFLQFQEQIKKHFKVIPNDFFNQIQLYKSFLQTENKKYNLTRLDQEELVYENYFFESLVPYQNIKFNKNMKVLDIGSGSGIPGILLKLMFPQIELTILEVTNKKVKFMKDLVNKLKINVKFLNQRAENITINQRESFDLVTSRAVAELKVLLEISTPYLKVNGLLVEPKSQSYLKELDEAKEIINNLGLKQLPSYTYQTQYFHHVFCFQKINKTDLKYPREWKQIIS